MCACVDISCPQVPLSEFGEGGEGGSCMRHRADCTDPAPTATASSAPTSRAPSPSAPKASSPATSSTTSCPHPSCACDAAAKAARPKAVGRKRGGAATPPSVTPACASGPCAGPVPFVSAPACCVCLPRACAQAQPKPHGFAGTNLCSGGAVTKPVAAPCASFADAAASVCVPAAARTLACAAGDGAGCGGGGMFEHRWNDEPFSTHVSGAAGNTFNVGVSGCCV